MMQSRPGTYALVLESASDQHVEIGKLGPFRVRPGFYVYVGSAFGPGGLKARIAHHVRLSEKPHWHMDYLRPAIDLHEVWFTYDSRHREHHWAGVMAGFGDANIPVIGFGASDCRCKSHLYFFQLPPSSARFRRRIHSALNPHGNIFIHKHLDKLE